MLSLQVCFYHLWHFKSIGTFSFERRLWLILGYAIYSKKSLEEINFDQNQLKK